MPRPTVAPLVLALGVVLMAASLAMSLGFLIVGVPIFVIGLVGWVRDLLPGRGHFHEPLVEPAQRPAPVAPLPGTVGLLREGMPGYRVRLPEKMHPISAGVKGGIVGGLVMPLPALVWSLVTGHGPWYPINLLAGMVLPGIGQMPDAELEEFQLSLLLVGGCIHAVMSVIVGLIYGVLLPTLPYIHRPVAWGGLLMPILWTGLSFAAMHAVNPALPGMVSWPWFVASQFVFGITMPAVVLGASRLPRVLAGVLGGLVGGAAMAVPAVLWSLASGHGLWYPVNLMAGMVQPGLGGQAALDLERFHADWFVAAGVMHAILSSCFGVLFALIGGKLPPMPAPIAWGALVMPLLWTGTNYALMGVVNPVLQPRVEWPWFIVSQFIFGLAASIVVVRSEQVPIPPAGAGPDRIPVTG
jgi:hypothetical protein